MAANAQEQNDLNFCWFFVFLHLQIIESIFWHRKITSNHLLQSENSEKGCTRYILDLVIVLISFLHDATFMKIGQNDSVHELARMLQASSKFNFRYLFIFYFDDLHLQIIESISPKASVENSSAQWIIF